MTQHLVLRQLRELRGGRAAHPLGDVVRGLADGILHAFFGERHQDAALAGRALLHYEGLVPARRAVVAQHAAVASQPSETLELGLDIVRRAHAVTSLTADTK